LDLTGLVIEVPHLATVIQAIADGFGRVDDRTSADCQDEVNSFLPAELDALMDLAQPWVRYDTSQRDIIDSLLGKGFGDPSKPPLFFRAFRSIMDQDFLAAFVGDQGTHLLFSILSEYDFCRGIVRKIRYHAILR